MNHPLRRPPVRYHGGKWRLAPWIISHFPQHRVYVEPFGGGAGVLLRKERSYAEIYNDLSRCIVNVFQVLRDQPDEFERLLRMTPFARDEFVAACSGEPQAQVEAARQTVLRSFMGFGSSAVTNKYRTGFRANSNRLGTIPAHDWCKYPDHVRHFAERLRGVIIENRDYRKVIAQQDGPDTLFYCDPPYVRSTRTGANRHEYEHEMSDSDHVVFAECVRELQGMAIVSGYRCDLYDDLFRGWERVDRKTYADGARPRTESLWLSPNILSAQPSREVAV